MATNEIEVRLDELTALFQDVEFEAFKKVVALGLPSDTEKEIRHIIQQAILGGVKALGVSSVPSPLQSA